MANKLHKQLINYFLVSIGTFLLAFGTVVFLTKAELVAGGLSGIAIIIQHLVSKHTGNSIYVYDYIVVGLTVITWLIGLIFIGKDFAMKTLLSSILYIGFTFLFVRLSFFDRIAANFAGLSRETGQEVGDLILCGLFGGVFIGSGVAITFIGGGSTGGVDVFQILLRKHLNIRESVSSFLIDGLIIVIGMATMQLWTPALCGILSSVVTAGLIEGIYIKSQTSYQVDVISNSWEQISRFVQDELERGATVMRVEGGFKGDPRVMLRLVIDKLQYEKLRDFIAEIDPNAFITFTQTNAVYGEGFTKNKKRVKFKKK